jgi:hypothetical protein
MVPQNSARFNVIFRPAPFSGASQLFASGKDGALRRPRRVQRRNVKRAIFALGLAYSARCPRCQKPKLQKTEMRPAFFRAAPAGRAERLF